MRVAIITTALTLLSVTSLVAMEDTLTPEIFNWTSNTPTIIVACATHGRLWDDIVSHKFEQERGHCTSAVECYMKEHKVSEEEACNELKKQVDDAWKDINYEMIFSETSKVVPMQVLTRVLNLARGTEFMYRTGDGLNNYPVGLAVKKLAVMNLHSKFAAVTLEGMWYWSCSYIGDQRALEVWSKPACFEKLIAI
ncbi:hypothetical protein V6N12_023514 [Hibiscus sabdariffa]|uniref:Terpene synthase metal-binding domain-containing protein n=1 Tax=Hibiscus sabdariffa TaxID=183260 RepID=A0ABR2FYT0_9ROSI